MLTVWKRWCRLCAKEDGDEVNVFVKNEHFPNLSEAIQKFFLITINPLDEAPTTICSACYKFLKSLVNFADRSAKVEAMFADLIFDKFNVLTTDLDCLRYQYGLSRAEPLDDRLRCDKGTDTTDLVEHYLHIEDDDRGQLYSVLAAHECGSSHSGNDQEELHDREETEMVLDEDGAISLEIKAERPEIIDEVGMIPVDDDGNLAPESECNNIDYIDEEYLEIKAESAEIDDEEVSELRNDLRPKRLRVPGKCREGCFKCSACEKEFSRIGNYRLHLKVCPINLNPPLYACSKCDKTFQTAKRVQQHEASHLPPEMKTTYPCRFCDKKFTKAVNVTAHVKAIHIGEKPFICEECGKTFTTKGALKEHKYTHVDDTPYQCSKCPKKFKNLPRLKTHEDTHNDTVYVCPHCGLQLNTKRTLTMHLVVHSDQRKYKCNYCGNEYKRSKALKNHLILHTGLRPYTCPFCDKTFANGSNCRSHKKKAHPLELAAMEAKGESPPKTHIPKLEQLKAVCSPDGTRSATSPEPVDSQVIHHVSSEELNRVQISSAVSHQIHEMHHLPQDNEQQQFQHSIFDQIEVSLNA